MIIISPPAMQALDDEAWRKTAAWLDDALPAAAQDDAELRTRLQAIDAGGRRHLVDHSVAAARGAGFRMREDVLALACLLLRHGPDVDHGPLAEKSLDPAERLAIMDDRARMRIARPVPPR